jgi:HNH endonuclease
VTDTLPAIRAALVDGRLGIDKVVELTRFATPATEERLVRWARGISCGAIRRRADVETRRAREDLLSMERWRKLSWWYSDEGTRFEIQGDMPAAQGAVVARTLERIAETLPEMPDEADEVYADARRADALGALCSARLADDYDADRATVVVHVRAEAVAAGESEDGAVLHPVSVDRLLCNARMQVVTEGEDGETLSVGRMSRKRTTAMLRQIRYRDRECRFPGCGARRFTEAHHVVWWRHGGRTDLENLVLICSFHHRLVHEHRWRLEGNASDLRWFRPDGTRYRAGPAEVAS